MFIVSIIVVNGFVPVDFGKRKTNILHRLLISTAT